MNWTGGQLHRSARQGALSKTQKQNFAKSRQLAVDRSSRHPSPFRAFSNLNRHRQTASRDDQIDPGIGADGQTESVAMETKSAGSQLPQGMSSSRNSQLDTLKHQLLQDPDWAAVSAARPLEIAFAPPEEIERFGKRRKLNDQDRKRLSAAHGGRPLPSLLRARETDALWNTDLERLQICINGRPVGVQSSDSQGMVTTNTSSQSMLLDHEETPNFQSSAPAKNPWTPSQNRISLQPSFGHAPPRFESPLSPLPRTPAFKAVGSIKRSATPAFDRHHFTDTNLENYAAVFSDRSVTQSPSVPGSPQPRHQHGTMHEEAFAKQTMVQGHARRPGFEISRRPAGILDASPNVLSPYALNHTPSSWLPQPQRPDSSSSPHTARSHAPTLAQPLANKSPHSNFSNPFLDAPGSDQRSPTAKVFGQIVQIRSDGADYE